MPVGPEQQVGSRPAEPVHYLSGGSDARLFMSFNLKPLRNTSTEERPLCAICLEEPSALHPMSQIINVPGCHHKFGTYCLDDWLKEHNTCPLCRTELFQYRPRLPPGLQVTPRRRSAWTRFWRKVTLSKYKHCPCDRCTLRYYRRRM
jgi:hypothetical protein